MRHVPFMAPSEFRAVLLDHQRKALEGNILHINLSTSLKEVAARGRRASVDTNTGQRVGGQRVCTLLPSMSRAPFLVYRQAFHS